MSRTDFCACTPFEFAEILKQWQERQQHLERSSWEQSRFIALVIAQQNSKKTLSPTDIITFSWEKVDKIETQPPQTSTKERFEEVCKMWGCDKK